jgi:hypothetical protein
MKEVMIETSSNRSWEKQGICQEAIMILDRIIREVLKMKGGNRRGGDVKVLTRTSNPYVDPSPLGLNGPIGADRIWGLSTEHGLIVVGTNFHIIDDLPRGPWRG